MKKYILLLLSIAIIAGCTTTTQPAMDATQSMTDEPQEQAQPEEQEETVDQAQPLWLSEQLTNVQDETTFSIEEFDEPVLVESFAVWCPTCTRQQQEVEKLKESRADFVSVALNTDPNENEEIVRDHAIENGFSGIYAVSPIDVTDSLVEEFGLQIINAPSVPMVLVCPDGTFKQLDRGVKLAEELEQEIEQCTA